MNTKKNIHVLPHHTGSDNNNNNNNWAVKGEKNKRNTAIKSTKQEAINRARQIAKNKKSELVIHNRDGRISDKDSYGNDPFPPRDNKR